MADSSTSVIQAAALMLLDDSADVVKSVDVRVVVNNTTVSAICGGLVYSVSDALREVIKVVGMDPISRGVQHVADGSVGDGVEHVEVEVHEAVRSTRNAAASMACIVAASRDVEGRAFLHAAATDSPGGTVVVLDLTRVLLHVSSLQPQSAAV